MDQAGVYVLKGIAKPDLPSPTHTHKTRLLPATAPPSHKPCPYFCASTSTNNSKATSLIRLPRRPRSPQPPPPKALPRGLRDPIPPRARTSVTLTMFGWCRLSSTLISRRLVWGNPS